MPHYSKEKKKKIFFSESDLIHQLGKKNRNDSTFEYWTRAAPETAIISFFQPAVSWEKKRDFSNLQCEKRTPLLHFFPPLPPPGWREKKRSLMCDKHLSLPSPPLPSHESEVGIASHMCNSPCIDKPSRASGPFPVPLAPRALKSLGFPFPAWSCYFRDSLSLSLSAFFFCTFSPCIKKSFLLLLFWVPPPPFHLPTSLPRNQSEPEEEREEVAKENRHRCDSFFASFPPFYLLPIEGSFNFFSFFLGWLNSRHFPV